MFFKNTTGAEDLLLDKLAYQLDSADYKELMNIIERMDTMVEDIKFDLLYLQSKYDFMVNN